MIPRSAGTAPYIEKIKICGCLPADRAQQKEVQWAFIRAAIASVADTAIVPMQDYLGLGSEARINTPSTLGENWQWRMEKGADSALAERMQELNKLYAR